MFIDRSDAGKQLANLLDDYKSSCSLIYALPKGGVAIGYEVANYLKLPLEIINIKKIGHPDYPEYAVGAVSESGRCLINTQEKYIDKDWLEEETEKKRKETIRRRGIYYNGKHAELSVKDKTAIIVDDGVATGLSLVLAINEVRNRKPKQIIVAVPIISNNLISLIKKQVDKLFILKKTEGNFVSVGHYYENFDQLSDKDVINLLSEIWNKKS